MKRLRLFCLFVTFGLLFANPTLLADETECCSEFQQHCDDWCSQNGHGTGLITSCWGWECAEQCYCTGLCGGQHCGHDDPGGTFCAPCGR